MTKSILANVFNSLLMASSGRIFCTLWNLKAFCLGRESRCSVESVNGYTMYKAHEGPESFRYFNREARGFLLYSFGFERRDRDISDVYFLDDVGLKDGDTVVDCGANFVDLYFAMARKNIAVNYFAFEPSPSQFACLTNNIKSGRLRRLALWYEDDVLDFYVSSAQADSSLIEPPSYDEKVTVECKRLDSIESCIAQ